MISKSRRTPSSTATRGSAPQRAKAKREKHKEKHLDELATEYGIDPMLVFKIVHGVTTKVFGVKKGGKP